MARRQKVTRKEKGKEINRRFEMFKSLMSSFVVGTVAVVAVAIFVPTSPKAEIIDAKAMIDTITYQVSITDEDNALDLSSLVVTLENQFEYYEDAISLGENSGYFDGLEPNTDYWLEVYGSKGFGLERLDVIKLTTRDKEGAFILGVDMLEADFDTTYMVDVSVYDPEGVFDSINLYYGYAWEHGVDFAYSQIPITLDREQVELFDVFTSIPFHIYLEGTKNGETEWLDEIWVTPPYRINSEMFVDYISDDAVGFTLYGSSGDIDIGYAVNVYKGNILLQRVDVNVGENMHETVAVISGLLPHTVYRFEGVATYINPQTLREESTIIYNEELTTLEDYQVSYDMVTYDGYIEVVINVVDPNDYFQVSYVELYELTDDFPVYLSGETYMLTPDGDHQTVTFTVTIPNDIYYHLVIGIRDEFNYMICHIIYDSTNE